MSERKYLSWEQFYMAVVLRAAERSKNEEGKNGACVVNEQGNVVGIGYTGERGRASGDVTYHAAAKAIMSKSTSHVNGCTIYTKLFPCNECTKFIIQAGIKKIIYMTDDRCCLQDDSGTKFEASKLIYVVTNYKEKSKIKLEYKKLTITGINIVK